jgi:hypothetical protein
MLRLSEMRMKNSVLIKGIKRPIPRGSNPEYAVCPVLIENPFRKFHLSPLLTVSIRMEAFA